MEINDVTSLTPNIQLFADHPDSFATTGEITSASAENASNVSENAENGTQTNTQQTEAKPFKVFASEADYQREFDFRVQQAIKTHEEKLKRKLEPEIRKQLEAEANMTAEQKVQAQLEQLEEEKRAIAREKARIKTEALFVAKGIGEAERQVMLDRCVTEDEEESAKNAQALLDAIDKAVKEQIKAAMKEVKAPNSTAPSTKEETPDIALAKQVADKRKQATQQAIKTLDYYIGGKHK